MDPTARIIAAFVTGAKYTDRGARPAETLWTIAEARLGSGDRWKDIAALNQGRVMDAAGTVFHADGALVPGWRLAMPASGPAAAEAAPAAAAGDGTVVVRRGDSLSAIATEHHV